jgi:hypothetical protein
VRHRFAHELAYEIRSFEELPSFRPDAGIRAGEERTPMAVTVVSRYPDMSAARYDQVMASLDLDANPPAGAILHVAGGDDDGFVVAEVWQTEETFRAFFDYRLRPVLRTHGVSPEPMLEIAPLRNVFAADMATVERMGSVSLPSTYSGSVL